jgi:hypothetical protein
MSASPRAIVSTTALKVLAVRFEAHVDAELLGDGLGEVHFQPDQLALLFVEERRRVHAQHRDDQLAAIDDARDVRRQQAAVGHLDQARYR